MISFLHKRKDVAYSFGGIFIIIFLIAIDQITKQVAVLNLKDQSAICLIENVLELQYLENTGIAFGMFAGKITFFLFTCILFLIAAAYFFYKIPKTRFYLPLILIGLVLVSGAFGNFIDRISYGFVIDFIYFKLIDFPIFNIADIYVVSSCILLFLLILFKYEDEDFKFLTLRNKEKKNG